MKPLFNAVGAYIYAGGFSAGLGLYLRVLAHLENGNFGAETARKNLEIPVYTEVDKWPLNELKNKGVACVFCNPPCAPWSKVGKSVNVKTNDEKLVDHRNTLKLIDELQPTVWMWESVSEAYNGKSTDLSEYVTEYGISRGYTVYHFLHDGKFLNLPQARRRVMTILSKVKFDFEKPAGNIITAGDALSDIIDPGQVPAPGKHQEYIPLVEPGKSLRSVYLRYNDPPGPKYLARRLDLNKPSGTQLGGPHLIHPTEDRYIGHLEAAALCGYPKWYDFDKNSGNYFAQIAKAVTPPVGFYMGKVTQQALELNEVIQDDPQEWEINYQSISNRLDDYRMQSKITRLR